MQNLVGKYLVIVFAMMTTMINGIREVGIGVILDMDSNVGKSCRVSILMALEEFYGAPYNNFTTIIQPHFRDSKSSNFEAASIATDLITNTQVMAILGPQQSSQANFVLDIANKYKVPILSPATSPSLSPKQNPYFIRIAQTSSTQAQPIAALVKSFGWKEIALVYEDTDFGRGPISYMYDAMVTIGTQVKYQTLLSPSSTDDEILEHLYKLKTMQTRVFVVHMLPTLASRYFKKASGVGMMAQGYAWIITDVLTSLLHYLDRQDIDSMKGVIGVKPYIPPSDQLYKFEKEWRKRFYKEYPEMDRAELDMFGIWSYDSIFALATALQRVEAELSATLNRPMEASPDLTSIETSQLGSRILPKIQNIRLKGLSGDFHVINGQLQTSPYQIVNVFGNGEKQVGLWNSMNNGLSNQTSQTHKLDYSTNIYDLGAIIWPGDTTKIPEVQEIPYCDENMQLRVGVPLAEDGFVELFEAYKDHKTNTIHASGLCMDIFYAVLDAMPCRVNYKLFLYETPDGKRPGDYNEFVYQVFNGTYDMVIGDVTILSNRSNYVDFTLPYSQSGVAILVPLKADKRKNAWIFMEPLETKLWITIGAFFIYTGFVIWFLEHARNKEFRGPPNQQVGMIFWFSFYTLVFAHNEKMTTNLSRFVLTVWVFVVLVLTSIYTAILSSMLTVQKLQPAFRTINELIARGDYIGCQDGSFIGGLLRNMSVQSDRLKKYINFFEYAQALSNGSREGGVSAIVDEVPYLKMLQAKNCSKYFMLDPIYKTAGFGFALPKGSPLVAEFSKAILKVVEGPLMTNLSNKWIGNGVDCSEKDGELQDFDKLTFASIRGLFYMAGLSSTCALVVFIIMFLHENKDILRSESSMHEKLTAIIQKFDEDKNKKPDVLETIDDSHVHVETTDESHVHVETIDDSHVHVETTDESHVRIEENMAKTPPPSPRTSINHLGEGVASPRGPIGS